MVRRLAARADGLIEGYRPGVMERLGLGPDELLEANPKLVYGRVTGWGQDGPLAQEAGHDINYIALTGLLHGIGPKERPAVPINYLGDYAGGGMMLAFGMVAALLAVQRGGTGPGDRRGDERRRRADRGADLWPARAGPLARRARSQPARRRRADLRHLSLRATASSWRSARSSRSSGEACSRAWPCGPAPSRDEIAAVIASADPRPMGRAFRRHRCLRRAGARPRRSAGPPAQYRAAHFPRPRRRVPARAGAALFGDAARSARRRRAARAQDGEAILAELGYGADEIASILKREVAYEPALRTDGNQRVRAHVPRRREAWRGQSGAGLSRFRLARRRSSTPRPGGDAKAPTNMRRRAACRRCARRSPTITAATTAWTSTPDQVCVTSGRDRGAGGGDPGDGRARRRGDHLHARPMTLTRR